MPRMRFDEKPQQMPSLTLSFLMRILSYFSSYPFHLVAIVLLTLASAGLGILPALLLQKIIDVSLPQKNSTQLVFLIGLSFFISIVLNFISVLQSYVSTWVAKKVTSQIKNQLYTHLTHLPHSFFVKEREGEILTRLTSDVDGIQQVFQTTILSALTNTFILVTSACTLFSLHPLLAFFSLFFLPLFIYPTRKVGKIRWAFAKKSQNQLSQLNTYIQETMNVGGNVLMKLFTNEKKAAQQFSTTNENVIALQLKETLTGRWFKMTVSLFTTAGPLLVYLVGGYLFIQGQMTLGSILTFATLLQRMYTPVMQLFSLQVDFMRSFALFQRIFDYLDLPVEPDISHDGAITHVINGEISFQHVFFSHHKEEKEDTLKDITLSIPAGKTTAIVGPSGAGKSTLTHFIPRLYLPKQGTITIDGIPLNDFSLPHLRQEIGMVTQDALLIHGTFLENLLYAKKDATKEEIIAATKAAYLHEFILSLPQQYDTLIGNRGVTLSGGEKQRLALARVLLKDPKILILDEATAALDTLSEHYVQKAMKTVMHNRTTLVIAHRLSTIVDADQIVVMEKGQIKEIGTHHQLLAKKGLYHLLHHTQAKHIA